MFPCMSLRSANFAIFQLSIHSINSSRGHSAAVSRILYPASGTAIICLCDQNPEFIAPRATASFPIWSCCGKGLPCGAALANTRRALTPPFHPYPNPEAGAVSFCCTVLSVEYRPQHPSFQKDSLLCAVRTFLSRHKNRERLPSTAAIL